MSLSQKAHVNSVVVSEDEDSRPGLTLPLVELCRSEAIPPVLCNPITTHLPDPKAS
jgi:hypothetical protein